MIGIFYERSCIALKKKKSFFSFFLGLCIPALFFSINGLLIADVGAIRPDADGTTVSGTATGGCAIYDCLNDVVTEPTSPDSGTDYVTWENIDSSFFDMGSITDVASVSSITVWMFHNETSSNMRTAVGLYQTNESTVIGALTNLPYSSGSATWDSITFSGLSLTQADLNTMKIRVDCDKVSGGTSKECVGFAMYADVTYVKQIEVDVAANGTQQNASVGATNAHVGGSFAISSLVGTRNVTSVTVAETGTVDALTDLDNIKLYYELDTTGGDGYNCSDQTYAGTETQFGTTDTDGFSAANGTSVFTASPGPVITTTATMCVYVVLDVLDTAVAAETVEIQITDPSTQIGTSDSGDVQPATAVALSGTTILLAPKLTQLHYHWRDDDGSESAASSLTGGADDTVNSTLGKLTPTRLRMEVSNEGNSTSASTQYRLEYGRKVSTCAAVESDSSWTDVGAGGGDWDMYDSANLTNGNNTTDIAESIGGVVNSPGNTFLTSNAGVLDTTSQSGGITLTSTQFVELEYSIVSTAASTEGYTYCFRVTNAGTVIDDYSPTAYPEATILADVNVAANGTQKVTVGIPTTNAELGADFVITDNIVGDSTVTSVTITASGTVDFQNDIDNIELWYDLDTTGGDSYNCSDESFDGDETQYGSTDTDGFTAGGISTFTQNRIINPTQTLCLYVVYDVLSSVSNDETFDVKIQDASTDVTISTGSVSPAALVDLAGMTTFVNSSIKLKHYHWRNDDGTETGATSATGDEDITLENLRPTVPKRIRFGIANEGSSTTLAYQFRLEYALKSGTCAASTGWTDVGAAGGAFDMYDSSNIASDGLNTTNIATTTGGVTDGGDTYLTTNAALKDTSSQTGNITLLGKYFVDLEYSITASTSATEGAVYCMRVTDAGTPISNFYEQYPTVEIKPKTDFYIQRNRFTMSGTSQTITAGTEYDIPAASTTAFIRITNTNNTGAGGGATGNARDVTVYISNPGNIENSITFTRPAGATGNTEVAWEIIEYVGAPGGNNEFTVRNQSVVTYVSGNTTVSTPTVTGIVDDTDVAVFITGSVNPDIGVNYPLGNSTAAWNSGSDIATFTRGASGNTSGVSYAVVEFVGNNWKIQRSEKNYSGVTPGTVTTASIAPVGSLTRAFLHTQKRMGAGLTTHGDYGHQVYFSGMGQISYVLDTTAGTPASHTSVAWVFENTQTIGTTMVVERSNGSQSGGTAPVTLAWNIGRTVGDIQDASIFMNNTGNEPGGGGGTNSFPEPMIAARLISTTQYELYVPDTNDSRNWRTEIVEWPTAARDIMQNYYRFYVDNDALDPTDPWPAGGTDIGENTEITVLDSPIAQSEVARLRMTLQISSAGMEPGIDSFKIQYGELESTCTGIGEQDWHDLGDIGSTTALWRGYDTSVTAGTNLSTDPPAGGALNISIADVAGTFEEENTTALTPFVVDPGEDVEFDWAIQNHLATEKTSYCFRMLEASGTLFEDYTFFPTMRTAGYTPTLNQWRFYDDETNVTPVTPLALENTAPIDIASGNLIKLRTTIEESTGGRGTDIKFKVQFSEYSDFSQGVFDVVSSTTCALNATTTSDLWCYADAAGVDNAVIDSAVLSDADACTGGAGVGCGTHNEGTSSTTATFDQSAYAITEYEFTLAHAGARANAVYYFRLYDMTNQAVVPASTTQPSLVTQGAGLIFTVDGLDSGTVIGPLVTDATTTANSILFDSIPFDTEFEAAHRLTIDTNATEGYQILVFTDQELTNTYGATIPSVTGSNATPSSWAVGCAASLTGCFGYHTTDSFLNSGNQVRFGAEDSYAAFDTTPQEVMYSSVPTNESYDIVYKIQVGQDQPAGEYQKNITYIAVPVF